MVATTRKTGDLTKIPGYQRSKKPARVNINLNTRISSQLSSLEVPGRFLINITVFKVFIFGF